MVGLFAGIGGFELGLRQAGFRTHLLCERDSAARSVLRGRFPDVHLVEDIYDLQELPRVDLLAAGFPCQDLSQVGRTLGIDGPKSSVVHQLFSLLRRAGRFAPEWIVIENVPFMLHLHQGQAIRVLIHELESLGYRWAHRVVDARAFGLPQRRQRVFLLASRTGDPRDVLLADDGLCPPDPDYRHVACGFYWTEGSRGLGWAVDAVPTLKGGSGLSIPSPPAILLPNGAGIVTPRLEVVERLMGFPPGWTSLAEEVGPARARWKLVGNAVSVLASEWIGQRLSRPNQYDPSSDVPFECQGTWPNSCWGERGRMYRSAATNWPVSRKQEHLVDFVGGEHDPLSHRAAKGFHDRFRKSSLRRREQLLDVVQEYIESLNRHVPEGRERPGRVLCRDAMA